MSTPGAAVAGNTGTPNMGGTTPPPASGTPSAAGSAAPDWKAGLSTDLQGYAQTKNFDSPATILESYKQLEGLLGVKDKLVKIPEKPDSEEWKDVYNRLGRPEKPEGYTLAAPKNGKLDEEFAGWAKGTFHELGISARQAEQLTARWNDYVESHQGKQLSAHQAAFEQETNTLKREWGASFDQNLAIAKHAAEKFGIDAEVIDTIEKHAGFTKVMKVLHEIGVKTGEHEYVGGNSPGSKHLTPEAAYHRKAALMKDEGFVTRFASGDMEAITEMQRLDETIHKSIAGRA